MNILSAILIDEYLAGEPDPPAIQRDRKTSREFYSKPGRSCPCIVPGCAKSFRPSTNYADFMTHYRTKHGKAETK